MTPKAKESKQAKTQKFHISWSRPVPFRLGGRPREDCKTVVDGLPVRVGKIKLFIWKKGDTWDLHEVSTGAFCVRGSSPEMVVEKFKRLLEETPDFKKQMSEFPPLSKAIEVPLDEYMKLTNGEVPDER